MSSLFANFLSEWSFHQSTACVKCLEKTSLCKSGYLQGLTTEEFLSPRNWASALQKTMEGERQHLSPHIGDFNDDSKTKISQNGLKYFLRNKQSRLFARVFFCFWLLESAHVRSMNERNYCLSCLLYTVSIFHDTVWLNQTVFWKKKLWHIMKWIFFKIYILIKRVYKPRVVFVVIREI